MVKFVTRGFRTGECGVIKVEGGGVMSHGEDW